MKLNYNFSKIFTFIILSSQLAVCQTTITQWNFNGTSATTVPGTTSSPSTTIGVGTAELVGGVTASFNSGVASGGSSDTETTSPPNFGWQTTNYAGLGAESKLRGVQFNVSTLGYQGIIFRFDQRLSNTSNNTYVVQYTVNRTATVPIWVDAQTFTFTPGATGVTGDVWYNLRTVNLSSVTGLDNNANVAFRIVSAFDPVSGNYLSSTSTSSYSPNGTVRLDMVTISATTLSVNDFEKNQNQISFYPNPVINNVIYFKDFISVSFFDVLGKNVLNANNVNQINIENLNKGIYFIKDTDGRVSKMIKN